MIENDLVSVLTPVYNGEAFLSRLLDSVLNQTYPHIEMILADDGSEDATREIAQAYVPRFEAKGYTMLVVSAPHKNASAAINTGLPYVKGRYLVWPDSDDELLPDSIEARVRFLETHPEYQCVRSVMEYVSNETGAAAEPSERLGDLSCEELFWDVLEGRSFVCCGCYMLRTEPFFQIYPERRIPEYEVGQNFQMLLPFLFRHRCPTIERRLYRVYVRPDSSSRRILSERQREKSLVCFEQMVDELMKICPIENETGLCRGELWKVRRRAWLARQYHHYIKFVSYRVTIIFFYFKYCFFACRESWLKI